MFESGLFAVLVSQTLFLLLFSPLRISMFLFLFISQCFFSSSYLNASLPICLSSFLQAGLVSPDCPEQLLIALEPEAASIYCRKLRLHQVLDLSLQPITNGFDLEGSRPFDSSFRQGSEERECVFLCVCLCVYFFVCVCGGGGGGVLGVFVISMSMKPQCVPGNVVGFHLGIVVYAKHQLGLFVCEIRLQIPLVVLTQMTLRFFRL